jgi:hypothetical protein
MDEPFMMPRPDRRRLVVGLFAAVALLVTACVGSDADPPSAATDAGAGPDVQSDDAGSGPDVIAVPPTDSSADTGTSDGGSPASLTLTGWWRASYTQDPWRAVASAGISATTGDLLALGTPMVGSPQNGLTPVDLSGDDALYNYVSMSKLFAAGAGSVIGVFKPRSFSAPSAAINTDSTIWTDTAGSMGVVVSSAGMSAYLNDGTVRKTPPATVALNDYVIFMMRWDGTNLGITVNSAPELTGGCGNASKLSDYLLVGRASTGSSFVNGWLLELMTINTALSDADYANVKSYVNARYSLNL